MPLGEPLESVVLRIVASVREALVMGRAYAVIAAIMLVLHGTTNFHTLGAQVLTAGAIYLSGALVVGVVVGVLQPLAASAPGSILVGFLAAFLPALALCKLLFSGPDGTGPSIKLSLLVACVLGGGFGLVDWISKDYVRKWQRRQSGSAADPPALDKNRDD